MNIPKSVWWLVIGMALNITGSSFLWPLNTIYMKQELGKSLTVCWFSANDKFIWHGYWKLIRWFTI